MKKILVPYDFSEQSVYALHLSAQFAEEFDCSVTLMNVIEHPTVDSFKTMGVSDYDPLENVYIMKLIEQVKAKMGELMENPEYSSFELMYKIVLGNPVNEIASEVNEGEYDLLVMGTKGSSGLDEFFVGSNAEKIVRTVKCPVISVKEEVDTEDIDEIVFATDMNKTSAHFMEQLKVVQHAFGAELRIVKINTPANFSDTHSDIIRMKKFAESHDLEDFSCEVYNYMTEEEGIVMYAEDIDAGLIALGTSQRTGLNHLLNASIAEDVVNHAKRPVWTFNLDA